MVPSLSGRPERVRPVAVGFAAVGLVFLFLYPYHQYYHLQVPTVSDHAVVPFLSVLVPYVWATAFAWGVAALVTGRIRSLTTARAAIVPLLTPLPFAVDAYRHPVTDVVPAPPAIRNWTPPSGPVDLAVRVFSETGFVQLAPGLFVLLGVAWARRRRFWTGAGVVALALLAGVHGSTYEYRGVFAAATDGFLYAAVVNATAAAIPGAVVFFVGYRLAATVEGPDPGTSNSSGPPGASGVSLVATVRRRLDRLRS